MIDEPELPEADEEPPLVERVDRPLPPKPPGPGFWGAILWCVLLLCVLYGGMIATAVVVWIGEGVASGDVQTFMNKERAALEASAKEGKNELPPGLANAVAWGMLVGQIGALIAVLLLIRVYVGRGWTKKLAVRRPSVWMLLLAVLATPGLMILHGGVHELVHAAFGVKMEDTMGPMLKSMFAGWPHFFAVLVIGVCPGVLEELFCRGFLGRGLVARYGYVGGVLLTSTMFGFLHILPLYALGTIFMGLALNLAYIASRSLWVPILIHALNNSVTILATLGTIPLAAAEQDAAALSAWIYLASFASVALLLGAMWTGREQFVTVDPPPYPTLETPPAGMKGELRAGTLNPLLTLLGIVATGALMWLIFG